MLPNSDQIESTTGSASSYERAKSWIETCEASHASCATSRKDSAFKPTRLLYVAGTSDFIRLHEGSEIPDGVCYTTLSHCWGLVVIEKLEMSNLAERKKAIPLASLTQTFQDAVTLTRRLGVEYIWIDSLCIVQDSVDDWHRESLLMEAVYGNSHCDIAATASSDGHGGCFRQRDSRVVRPCIVPVTFDGCTGDYHLSDLESWQDQFNRLPLNHRAWVLQERVLSPRVLHFGQDQLLWECNEMMACERHPLGLSGLPILGPKPLRIPHESTPAAEREQLILRVWAQLIQTYSACKITKDTDRLIALHGVAMKVKKLLGSDYTSGLWARGIEHQLGWSTIHGPQAGRPSEHVAPSWSWASVVGEVLMPHGVDEGDTALCKVLQITTPDNGSASSSPFISHDVLVIRCYLVPVTISPELPREPDGLDELLNNMIREEEAEDSSSSGGDESDAGEANEEAEDSSSPGDDEEDAGEAEEDAEENSSPDDDEEDAGEDEEVAGDEPADQASQGTSEARTDSNLDYDLLDHMSEFQDNRAIIYTTATGDEIELNLQHEPDDQSEWNFDELQPRWLMPTSNIKDGDIIRGLILGRDKDDEGLFRRYGTFTFTDAQDKKTFWDCCRWAMDSNDRGLEKSSFDGVPEPDFSHSTAGEDHEFLGYKIRNQVAQFVISLT